MTKYLKTLRLLKKVVSFSEFFDIFIQLKICYLSLFVKYFAKSRECKVFFIMAFNF